MGTIPPDPRCETVFEAQQRVFEEGTFEAGSSCPCCDRLVRRWKVPIQSGMAAALIWMVGAAQRAKAHPEGWVNLREDGPRTILRSNSYSKLRYWHLVEQRKNTDTSKKASGVYRATELGKEFVLKGARVAKYVWLYNDMVHAVSEETVDIHGALRSKFDFAALLNGTLGEAA